MKLLFYGLSVTLLCSPHTTIRAINGGSMRFCWCENDIQIIFHVYCIVQRQYRYQRAFVTISFVQMGVFKTAPHWRSMRQNKMLEKVDKSAVTIINAKKINENTKLSSQEILNSTHCLRLEPRDNHCLSLFNYPGGISIFVLRPYRLW